MKKSMIISMGLVALISMTACGQKKEVPNAVSKSFAAKFPTAKNVKWDKENDTEWEAEFKMSGVEYSANFDNDGTWKETEHEINESEIPAMVKATLDNEFSGYEIEEVEISETVDGKVYEFALDNDENEMEVAIDMNGKVIKKEMKEGEDEDND